jgi:hypothetical protein
MHAALRKDSSRETVFNSVHSNRPFKLLRYGFGSFTRSVGIFLPYGEINTQNKIGLVTFIRVTPGQSQVIISTLLQSILTWGSCGASFRAPSRNPPSALCSSTDETSHHSTKQHCQMFLCTPIKSRLLCANRMHRGVLRHRL